jgi:hypothetical protein
MWGRIRRTGAPPARSAPGGLADVIGAKAEVPVGMSAVGGRADVACQELSGPFLAKSGSSWCSTCEGSEALCGLRSGPARPGPIAGSPSPALARRWDSGRTGGSGRRRTGAEAGCPAPAMAIPRHTSTDTGADPAPPGGLAGRIEIARNPRLQNSQIFSFRR